MDRTLAFTSRTSLADCEGCDAVHVIDGSRSEELGIMGGAHIDVQAFSSQAVDAVKSSEQRLVLQVVQEESRGYIPFVVEEVLDLVIELPRHSVNSLAVRSTCVCALQVLCVWRTHRSSVSGTEWNMDSTVCVSSCVISAHR